MLAYARSRNLKRIGLFISNNGWGRSNGCSGNGI